MKEVKFKLITLMIFIIAVMSLIFSGCGGVTIDISPTVTYVEAVVIPGEEDIESTPEGSLPIGSYVLFGNYKVESEEPAPILWKVIENKSHYKENNPDSKHMTLLTEYIIDLRGIDGAEPESDWEFRAKYGNNRYSFSNIRQWLNSDKKANDWWVAQHETDSPPIDENFESKREVGYEDKDGFLSNFSTAELNLVMDTMIVCGINKNVDDGGTEMITDKFFLLSLTEVRLSDKESKYYFEGNPFVIFDSFDSRKTSISLDCRENTNSIRVSAAPEDYWDWWLRSPYSWGEYDSWLIDEKGTEQHRRVYIDAIGLRPAVNIKYEGLTFSGSGTIDEPYDINS